MAAYVTSHRMPLVLGALIVALAAFFAATWLGARWTQDAPPPPTTPAPATEAPVPAQAPIVPEVDIAQDLASPAAPSPRRRQRTGVPLNAPVTASPEDFEVLSAAELDAISQARD